MTPQTSAGASVAPPAIIDRVDVQKSSKTLEAVMNAAYEYCQVTTMLSASHKKLAKTLRDAAASKGTSQAPAKAFGCSAGIFEALAEVDQKFVKIIEKEYDSASTELKKCIRKIAKEDKALDDYTMDAKKAIRQAGETYEKKAKRKEKDLGEEHARYTTLLSKLGAEMADAKNSHGLFITQKHNTTSFSLAACLARIAEGEWVRYCESVRRCSPSVGALGESRAHCEGGTHFFPDSLPDLGVEDIDREKTREAMEQVAAELRIPNTSHSSSDHDIHSQHHHQQPRSLSTPNLLAPPPLTLPIPQTVAAPLARRPATPPTTTTQHSASSVDSHPHGSDSVSQPLVPSPPSPPVSSPQLPDAPNQQTFDFPSIHSSSLDSESSAQPEGVKTPPDRLFPEPTQLPIQSPKGNGIGPLSTDALFKRPPSPSTNPPLPIRDSFTSDLTLSIDGHALSKAGDHSEGREDKKTSYPRASASRNLDNSRGVVRTISLESNVSNGSLVAAMRDRLVERRSVPPASPPPVRDLPRPSSRVSNLASRYTSLDLSSSIGNSRGIPGAFPLSGERYPPRSALQESPESVWKGERDNREQELQWQERELQIRQEELELERRRLRLAREGGGAGIYNTGALAPSSFPQGPLPVQRSYTGVSSTTSLHPPSRRVSTPPPRQLQSPPRNKDHSAACGCYECSAKMYSQPTSPPTASQTLPPAPPIELRPQKERTWVGKGLRRLSMPVGAAFSLDSKKISPSGISNVTFLDADGRRSFDKAPSPHSLRSAGTTRR